MTVDGLGHTPIEQEYVMSGGQKVLDQTAARPQVEDVRLRDETVDDQDRCGSGLHACVVPVEDGAVAAPYDRLRRRCECAGSRAADVPYPVPGTHLHALQFPA